jgi:hypothetical protein
MATAKAFGTSSLAEAAKAAASYYSSGATEWVGTTWVAGKFVAEETAQSVAETVGDVVGDSIEIRADFYEAIEDGDDLADNPWFQANGIDGPSPETQWYFRKQGWIKKASFAASAVGKVSGWFVGWNVADLAQHGSAAYNAHSNLNTLHALAQRLPKGGTLEMKLNHVIKLKQLKRVARGGGLAAASVPYAGPALGAAANVAKSTAVTWWDAATTATAAATHWQAYREGVIGRGAATGPATRIIKHIFEDYTIAGALFAEDLAKVRAIIAEPQGWLVIADKLNAI